LMEAAQEDWTVGGGAQVARVVVRAVAARVAVWVVAWVVVWVAGVEAMAVAKVAVKAEGMVVA